MPIPEGFARIDIEGENTIEDGLVITDAKGNEYVWIPCTKAEYESATDQKGTWNKGNYDGKTWDDTTVAGTISYADRLLSVETYGGFYVARYEAGIPEEMTGIYANTDGVAYNISRSTAEALQCTPVSKKGVQAWNYISQTNAKAVAKKMVSNNKTAQSYLIDSYAWDLVCKKINSKYGTAKNITDSTTWGNYYNNITTDYASINTLFAIHTWGNNVWSSCATNYQKGLVTGAPKGKGNSRLELATGSSEDFKAYNLYDIAGNMWEWTTETSSNGYAVLRSGGFHYYGGYYPAVYRRGDNGTGGASTDFGFRSVVYVK